MSASGGGRRKKHHEEEHENHERWLVTYADMLTVLMALFIVMFALSIVDKKKFEQFANGAANGMGTGEGMLNGGDALLAVPTSQMTLDVEAAKAALAEKQSRAAATGKELQDLEAARQKILASLQAKQLQDSVRFRLDERGLVVTVVTDDVLFELGSATLRPAGTKVLDAIAPALKALPNPVTVEGHTDNLPISGGRYASNWELSTERATSVLRYVLQRHAVPAKRLSAAGYADQRPVADNSPAGRSQNRRVEVIVRATAGTPAAASATTITAIPDPIPPITGITKTPATSEPASAAADPQDEKDEDH